MEYRMEVVEYKGSVVPVDEDSTESDASDVGAGVPID